MVGVPQASSSVSLVSPYTTTTITKSIHTNSSSYRFNSNTTNGLKKFISMPNNLAYLSQVSSASTSSSSSSSSSTSTVTTTFSETNSLEDWVYWQRDLKNMQSWTKVYAVLENEFLWLYGSDLSSRTLLIQIAVASVEVSGDNMFRLMDPNNEIMEISLYDPCSFSRWRERLQEAAEMTATYFQVFAVNAKTLPRGSIYRGSLVAYRKVNKRTKCKAVIQWMVTTCKNKILTTSA